VNKSRSHISRQGLTLQLWGRKRLYDRYPIPVAHSRFWGTALPFRWGKLIPIKRL